MAKGRSKPLQGAKKQDKVLLECTVKGCDTEFYVSYGTTPALRRCQDHFENPPAQSKRKTNITLLDSLNKAGILSW